MLAWINALDDFMYTYILVFLLAGGGIYFTIRTRGAQFRLFPQAVRAVGERKSSGTGVSSFQALMISTASRVGTGNIAGVSTAIAVGGPGAVFWMWLLALLGSASAFVETTLAQIYKTRDGALYRGGPAYYIQIALGKRWLGVVFAVLLILCFAYGFNGLQAYNVMSAVSYYTPDSRLAAPLIGLGLAALTAYSIFGGSGRISDLTTKLVPPMAVIYLGMALIMMFTHLSMVPGMLAGIFTDAFSKDAFAGGFAGSCVVQGIKRGLFSNEAGMGSAPNAAAAADVAHPVCQGLVAVISVFLDTILICSATAFLLLLSGVPGDKSLQGIPYVQTALQGQFGTIGVHILTLSIFLFAFTSILGNYYYTESNLLFIKESKPLLTAFRCTAVAMVFVGAQMDFQLAWNLADIFMGGMAIVNLCAIFLLGGIAFRALRHYERQIKTGEPLSFRAREIGLDNTPCWK